MANLFHPKTLFNNQLRQLHRSIVALSIPKDNLFQDKKAFDDLMPEVMDSILTSSLLTRLPEVRSRVRNLFDHTLEGGKRGRALSVGFSYRMLEKPENITDETMHATRILACCIEMTYFLVVDDIIDASTTRRGKTCWYLQPNVGSAAINDTIFMYQLLMEALRQKFGKTPIYTEIIRIFNEAVQYVTIGQHLEYSSLYNKEKNNIDLFTMDRYNTIVMYKTCHYSFNIPIKLALLLVKNGKEKRIEQFNHISFELGKLLQIQNDYKDIYIDEIITGKAGTDIQEGKLSWVAVTALGRCNESQRSIFKEYYGSKDPEHVKRIKQLYDELQLPQVYSDEAKSRVHDYIMRLIQALPTDGEKNLFIGFLDASIKQNI